jgi:bifunctional non-homologous end joining protein LigD
MENRKYVITFFHFKENPMQATLYCTNGSSDKIYQAEIVPSDEGYAVNFAYGRRGSALKSGTKTKAPVGKEKAQAIFDKLIKSKTAKGYSPDVAGATYTSTDSEMSDYPCQLLNSVSEEEAIRLCNHPDYIAQEKFDGIRQLLHKNSSGVRGINRKGLYVGISKMLSDTLEGIDHQTAVLDCEGLGDFAMAFDLLELDGRDLRNLPYTERYSMLFELDLGDKAIQVVYTAHSTDEKVKLMSDVKARGGEGVVFKHVSSAYIPSRPSSGGEQLKFKYTESASVLVSHQNEDRRSVKMQVYTDDGTWIDVGNVTIPPNFSVPEVGQTVEVRYLYAFPNGSIFQPVYLGERTDVGREACRQSQLKYKPDNTLI